MIRQSGIDIIGVPLDLGVKELGLKIGPDALREAGVARIASRLGFDVRDLGNLETQDLLSGRNREDQDHGAGAIASYCDLLGKTVAETVRQGRLPICLGGDHSLAIGSLAGVSSETGPVGCLWVDAHPDANTPETSPTGNIHGMPVAVILGHGPKELTAVQPAGAKVRYENMCLIGTRDADQGELDFLAEHKVCSFSILDVIDLGLPSVMRQAIARVNGGTRGVHVSLDLDVLHVGIAPGVGLPSQCGFDMREATYICQQIAAHCEITSIDVVGFNPVRDSEGMTAKRAIELLMMLLGKTFSFDYHRYLLDQHGDS